MLPYSTRVILTVVNLQWQKPEWWLPKAGVLGRNLFDRYSISVLISFMGFPNSAQKAQGSLLTIFSQSGKGPMVRIDTGIWRPWSYPGYSGWVAGGGVVKRFLQVCTLKCSGDQAMPGIKLGIDQSFSYLRWKEFEVVDQWSGRAKCLSVIHLKVGGIVESLWWVLRHH